MCIYRKKLLERVALPPRTGVRGWVSAPNCWQVLWVTGGGAQRQRRICRNNRKD